MTLRQFILKLGYPLWMLYHKITGRRARSFENKNNIRPSQSFYELSVTLNSGNELKFDTLHGKKVLLVNTASDCGYTAQYDDLQALHEQEVNLVVIGFPANDFKQQEQGTDEAIAQFCKLNYGITFPLTKKTVVKKGQQQNTVYTWLSDSSKNGWCNKQPSWNFSKYLVNEKGMLTHYFDPGISPLSDSIRKAIHY